ncbi:MAG: Mfa1 family fimbria major subunit [Bacteroidaceae bacterium]|nr:Mfa1 family fimbria major subunit [Bacteroidaceae bacterium]
MLAVFSLTVLSACREDEAEGEKAGVRELVKVGDMVPEFTLTDADGQEITSSSLRGKTFLLSFFDTTCPDCQKELPVLQQIYETYKDVVPVLNVPRSQTLDVAKAYWSQAGLTMPLYSATDNALYYKFATSGIPRTYVVDGDGLVRAVMTDSPLADFTTIDDVLRPLAGSEGEVESGYTRLILKLKLPAPDRGEEGEFFKNEYLISHFAIYLFDSKTKNYVTKATVDDPEPVDASDHNYDAGYDITYIIRSMRVKVGLYDIFAVANYDKIPDDIENEKAFLNLIDTESYPTGIEPYIPEKGAIMSNHANSLLKTDLTPWDGKNCYVKIEMERVLAKLQIGIKEQLFELRDYHNEKYADVKITNYKLVNLNKCFYLFQHTDRMEELTEQPDFRKAEDFTEYEDENGQYIVDPHFYDKKADESTIASLGSIYASWFGDFNTDNFAAMPPAGTYGYAYIMENTSFKTSQKNGYSAGIVFKAAVSPVSVWLYDVNSNSLKKEARPEYWGDAIYLYKNQFYGSIQAINAGSSLGLDELAHYTNQQLKNYGIKKCSFNQGVYETYYTYWIRHRMNSTNPMGPMSYGIGRNNFYKIRIAGVSGLGDSMIEPEIARDNYPNSYLDIE